MWMPRAATSVATRTGVLPSLKSEIARLRAFWAFPPCRAPAAIPSRRRILTSRSTPCLVRTNRIVRPSRAAISVTTRGLAAVSTTSRWCSIVSTCDVDEVDRAGHRVVQVAADDRGDLAVERGGEQQPLPVGGGEVEDRADLGQEAHVGHPVGLVDRGDLDRREVAGALVRVVGEPPGGGDQQIDPALQLAGLPVERHPADHRGDGQARAPSRTAPRRPRPAARARGSGPARGRAGRRGWARPPARRESSARPNARVLPEPV